MRLRVTTESSTPVNIHPVSDLVFCS